jgi:hypothetical protein
MNSQNKKHELGESLIDSIIEPNTDAMNDIAESLLDGLLEGTISEAAQEIPIIKSVVGIAKAGIGIKDYYFQKKLIRFLSGVNKTDKEIYKRLGEAYKDKKAKQDFGEQILMTIDRLETLKKIDALIKIFSAFAKGEIDQQEFFRYSYVLENIDFNNLDILVQFYISEFNFNITNSRRYLQDRYNNKNEFTLVIRKETSHAVSEHIRGVSWRKMETRKNDYFFIQNFINVGLISIDNYSLSQEIKEFVVKAIQETIQEVKRIMGQSSSSFRGFISKSSNPLDGNYFMGMAINQFGIKFLEILEIFYKEENNK